MFVGEHETCGAYYEDETMSVDGKVWINCQFVRCTLRRDDPKTQLRSAIYSFCTFEGDGWPGWNVDRFAGEPSMLDYGPRNIRITLDDDELNRLIVSLEHYVRNFGGDRNEQLLIRLSTLSRRKNKKYNDSLPAPQHHRGMVTPRS